VFLFIYFVARNIVIKFKFVDAQTYELKFGYINLHDRHT